MRMRKGIALLALLLIVGTLAWAWQTRWLALGWYWIGTWQAADEWRERGVWLPYYRVDIEAREIEGIDDDASGLTYNDRTGTLFSVINAPPMVAELSLDGELLRRIPIRGVRDPEGITHVTNDIFVISDEREHQIYKVRIDADTEEIDVRDAPRLGLGFDFEKNLGFEGLSWDAVGRRLYVVKESAPLRVFMIDGLPELLDGSRFDLQISEWKSSRASTLFVRDLSSLTLHEATGNLLLLSDESALVVEYAPDGRPISVLPLWKGWHGLNARVPQAEGVAMGPQGELYVLSEPNLFYRFERTKPPHWVRDADD